MKNETDYLTRRTFLKVAGVGSVAVVLPVPFTYAGQSSAKIPTATGEILPGSDGNYLTTLAELRITLDISHWCNLHARAALHPIARR